VTIGFYSPLPPANTGVADYSAALLRALRCHGTVQPNSPGDIALYHIGNNQLHRGIYHRALRHPGIAVLHDAVLQHFFLGSLDREAYIDEFVYNYGEWMRDCARDLWTNRARSAADPRYFEFPMLKRIAETSRAVVVHNPAAARIVARHAPAAKIVEIPHLFEPPAEIPLAETLRFRIGLGLKPRTLVVAVFGHLRESKRLQILLRAMDRVWASGSDAVLLIAGEFSSTDLARAIAPHLRHPRILHTGYLSERDFWRFASITDLCVNLRYPAAGETSGIAVRLMGIGKAVACTEGEEIAKIPGNACLRIDAGPPEIDVLADTIQWLASEPDAARKIGENAAKYIAEQHAPQQVAEQFWKLARGFVS
jgi:glycosyltransferase involved in cell wall biosynthesis